MQAAPAVLNVLGTAVMIGDFASTAYSANQLDLDPFSLYSYQLLGGGTPIRVTGDGNEGLFDPSNGTLFLKNGDGTFSPVY